MTKYICINSYEDYLNFKNSVKLCDYIFRGVTSEKFHLIPSLYRGIEYNDNEKLENIYFHERDIFDFCVKDGEPLLKGLTEMQHHGIATRLLDFTFNIDVALTFALYDFYTESLSLCDNSLIYVIKKDKIIDKSNHQMLSDLIYYYDESSCIEEINSYGEHAKLENKPVLFVPDNKFERIKKQNSCFLLYPQVFDCENDYDSLADYILLISKFCKKEIAEKHKIKIGGLK